MGASEGHVLTSLLLHTLVRGPAGPGPIAYAEHAASGAQQQARHSTAAWPNITSHSHSATPTAHGCPCTPPHPSALVRCSQQPGAKAAKPVHSPEHACGRSILGDRVLASQHLVCALGGHRVVVEGLQGLVSGMAFVVRPCCLLGAHWCAWRCSAGRCTLLPLLRRLKQIKPADTHVELGACVGQAGDGLRVAP